MGKYEAPERMSKLKSEEEYWQNYLRVGGREPFFRAIELRTAEALRAAEQAAFEGWNEGEEPDWVNVRAAILAIGKPRFREEADRG